MSRGNWKMRKMVSIPKLIIVMKPNLSVCSPPPQYWTPVYIILENIIEHDNEVTTHLSLEVITTFSISEMKRHSLYQKT